MAVRWLDISENRRRRRRGEKSPTANVSTQERCKAFHKARNHGSNGVQRMNKGKDERTYVRSITLVKASKGGTIMKV